MKYSLHSIIPFLPLFCSCQFRRLDSIQFLCSQAHILAGWLLELVSVLDSTIVLCWTLPYNHFAQITQKTQLLLSPIVLCVFTAPQQSNGRNADHIENSLPTVGAFLPRARVYRVVASQCVCRSQYIWMAQPVTEYLLQLHSRSDIRSLVTFMPQFISLYYLKNQFNSPCSVSWEWRKHVSPKSH
jgi:hypothetical protein